MATASGRGLVQREPEAANQNRARTAVLTDTDEMDLLKVVAGTVDDVLDRRISVRPHRDPGCTRCRARKLPLQRRCWDIQIDPLLVRSWASTRWVCQRGNGELGLKESKCNRVLELTCGAC